MRRLRPGALQGGSVPDIKEIHLNLLRYLEAHPQVSQRELADHLGVSLGKTNYCLRALVDKGLVKARNFKNNKRKRAYLYILTPAGIDAKARIAARFLQRKMDEYEVLKAEIVALQTELQQNGMDPESDESRNA